MTTQQKLTTSFYQKAIKEGKARDEFYTRYEDIEEMLPEWDLSDKKVWALADGDESEFVKYFSQKGKCKEFIHTSDDFRTHEDLFKWCDIVVTNPPFSLKTTLRDLLTKYKKDYILVLPILPQMYKMRTDVENFPFKRLNKFKNGKSACCQWFSNLGTAKHPYGFRWGENFGREIPTTDQKGELFRATLKQGKQVYKYLKKTGFPIDDEEFVVSSDNNCAEFEVIKIYGIAGNLVKWRKGFEPKGKNEV